jgi:hypothetical protein
MSIACPKCGYLRQPAETVPDWQCPKCGVAYSKVGGAPMASQSARSSRQAAAQPASLDSDELQPVTSAPSLFTLNGFGFKLYGSSDEDMDDSYMTTHYLVFFFIPVAPLARYRVIRDGDRYAFLGKGGLRTIDKVHLGIAALMVLWFFLANRSH